MTAASEQPGFPTIRAAAAMTAAALLATPVAWFGVPALVGGGETVARVVPTMVMVVWLASLGGLMPVALLGPLGVMHTVFAYFGGTALRIVGCLIAWMVVVRGMNFHAALSGMTLVVVYLPLLFVEVAFVGWYLWHKDQAVGQGNATHAMA